MAWSLISFVDKCQQGHLYTRLVCWQRQRSRRREVLHSRIFFNDLTFCTAIANFFGIYTLLAQQRFAILFQTQAVK